MAWFKIDDALWSHPKFLGLSDGAFRLWVRAGAYSAQHTTDGIITPIMLKCLVSKPQHAQELWSAGLWERIADGGYRFHDWHDYQPSRDEIEARRKADRDRQRAWRESRTRRAEDA
jgi:hypothetical protein